MEEPRRWYLQGLWAQVRAFAAARRAFLSGEAGVPASVARLAGTLARGGREHGLTGVADAAAAVAAAGEDALVAKLDALTAALLAALESERNDRAAILIISDDPGGRRALPAVLASPAWDIHLAGTWTEADRVLDAHDIALVVVDLDMAGGGGRDVLVHLRRRVRDVTVPVVVITSRAGTRVRTECYALGADEVIGKPYDPESLTASVSTRLRRSAETTRWARLDMLTGLPNRAAFRRAWERLESAPRPAGSPATLAVLDIDRLKDINDRFGHAKGDEVLKQVAALLAGSLRRTDVLARWGGEEFTALFPDTGEEDAARSLEHALHGLRALPFRGGEEGAQREFLVTFSAGVAEVPPGARLEEAFLVADDLLYHAKAAGRNLILTSRRAVLPLRRVVLVEDDPVVATVVRGLLDADGLETILFEDGVRATEQAADLAASLFILDIRLPRMNGFDVLHRLREIPGCARIPVLLLTAMREPADIARGFDLGADDYVVKPFAPVELRARIRRLLRRN